MELHLIFVKSFIARFPKKYPAKRVLKIASWSQVASKPCLIIDLKGKSFYYIDIIV